MTQEQQERPTFLTVLCILSYVGLGWTILSSLFGLAMAPFSKSMAGVAEAGMEEAMDEIASDAPQMLPFMENIFGGSMELMKYQTPINLVNIVCAGIALWGVIMMWKLRKTGFFLYTAGKLIIVLFPLVLVGGNFITGITSALGFFFAGLFILLYGLNLKSMN